VNVTSPTLLTYGRHNPLQRRLRRLLQVLMIADMAALAHGPVISGSRAAQRYVSGYAQRRSAEGECMTYTAPSGTLVVDDGPLRAANAMVTRDTSGEIGLLGRSPSDSAAQAQARRQAIAGLAPKQNPGCRAKFASNEHLYLSAGQNRVRCVSCLRQMASFFGPTRLEPVVLLLHSRRSGGMPRRLVSVTFNVGQFEWGTVPPFFAGVYADGGFRPSLLCWYGRLSVPELTRGPSTLKLFAGQPDSADESHFTIDAIVGGETRMIDGWLMPDDHVKLQLRAASGTRSNRHLAATE
jgi:hypothetical protein